MKLTYNDSSHSYWLDGRRVKSASKVAGIAADKFTVEQWGKRMVAIGMTLRPDLAERVAVDLDNKQAIQDVCDDAHTAAKGNARAERGTQRHRVLELSLLGQQDQFVTAQQIADAEVLARTLDAYELEPMPDLVEQFIAYPDHGVVGRFDAVLRRNGVPGLYDLKGGENAVKYPHSTITQLALYLFAPHVSAAIVRDGDRSTVTEWTTMPADIDTETAYVIYCDDHHDVGELWALNMTHGREGADLALRIVDWRKKHQYGEHAVRKIEQEGKLVETLAASITKESVVNRYNALTPAEQEMFKTQRAERGIDNDDTDTLAKLLDDIYYLRTDTPPEPIALEPIGQRPPPAPAPAEGPEIGDVDLGPLGEQFNAMSGDAARWFQQLLEEGRDGHSWEMRAGFHRTVRRYEIYRALILLGSWDEFGDYGADTINTTVVEPLVWAASGNDDSTLFANVTPGVAIGSLDIEQAKTFSRLVDDYLAHRVTTIVDEGTERWRLEPAA